MADTAIDIARNAAAMGGLNPPATLTGGDTDQLKLLSLLNIGCKNLSRKRGPYGESWPSLVREHVVDTIADQPDYPLPGGFSEIVTDTAWNRSTYRPSPGPLTGQEYQRIKGGLVDTVALTSRYRLKFNENLQKVRFTLDPIPAGVEQIAFEYISRYWVRESESSPVSLETITRDTDITIFPDHLVTMDLLWRWKKSNGLAYVADLAEFEMERDRVFSQTVGLRDAHMTSHSEYDELEANLPESGFGDAI